MDKYIKINDLVELIKNHNMEIDKDYEDGKICFSSKVAMNGVLEVLRKAIIK